MMVVFGKVDEGNEERCMMDLDELLYALCT
jgi:hypothetical protein